MKTKVLEVRDHSTRIPVLAIRTVGDNLIETAFFRAVGFLPTTPCLILMKLEDQRATYQPEAWAAVSQRTMPAAHKYIAEHWYELIDGDVVDVRVALGEAEHPCKAEIWA